MKRRFQLPWRSRAKIDAELDTELQFHIDMRVADLMKDDMSEADARAKATAEFGDMERTREVCRDEDTSADRTERLGMRLDELRANILHALRAFRRNPGYAAVSIVTLALAIGANTAIFSAVDAVALAPLPYAEPDRLVSVFERNTQTGSSRREIAAADMIDFRAAQKTLTGLGYYARSGATIRDGDADPVALFATYVSPDLFDILGVRPLHGRSFHEGEDKPGAESVVILPFSTWRRLFGSDTSVLNRAITLNGNPARVVGIMPETFGLGMGEQIYAPLDLSFALNDPVRARRFHLLFGFGRLKPGVSIDAARADLVQVSAELEKKYPDQNTGHSVSVIDTPSALNGDIRRSTFLLLAGAGLVLLIAGANLTNMTLARALGRRQEMAVRAAIGATRGHLVRQAVVESLTLAALGGTLGIVTGVAATRLMVSLNPAILPPLARIELDWRVLAFTTAVTVVLGVVVGLVPALRAIRGDLRTGMTASSRTAAGDRHAEKLRPALVVAQVALTVVLLVGAGLLVRSLDAVRSATLGFDPDHVLTGFISAGQKFGTLTEQDQFFGGLIERVRAMPGVKAVGAASAVPLLGSAGCGLVIEGIDFDPAHAQQVRCAGTRPEYFKALGAKIVAGRDFSPDDRATTTQVVLVNQAFVRTHFPNTDPLGKRIRLGPNPAQPWETIIGVVADIRNDNLEQDATPAAFESSSQHTWSSLGLVVRTTGDPMLLLPSIRAALREAAPTLALQSPQALEVVVDGALARRRFGLGLAVGFALLALVVAAVGIYGVLAYLVTTRMREFGVRMALGATSGAMRSFVLREGVRWIAVGIAIGSVAAFAVARATSSVLYGVSPGDPVTFAVAGALLAVIALAACIIPAERATRADPIIALRQE